MLRAPAIKRLGAIKLTFEDIEHMLGIRLGSIEGIEVNLMTQSISIIHNDEEIEGVCEVPSGGLLQTQRVSAHYTHRILPPRKEKI
jgi:hypothetical protein